MYKKLATLSLLFVFAFFMLSACSSSSSTSSNDESDICTEDPGAPECAEQNDDSES